MSRLDELLQEKCPDGVEYKQLKDILTIKNGSDYKKYGEGNIPVYGSGGVMTHIDTFAYDKPSVLIPRKGSLDKLYYVDVPFWTVDTIFWTDIDVSKVEPKYVYYCLEKKHLEKLNKAGGVPSLTQEVLNRVEVPVPPLEVQREIVRILDKFTQLRAELSAELSARRIQYEYYRNELLTFENDVPKVELGDICDVIVGGEAPDDCVKGKDASGDYIFPIWANGQDVYGYAKSYTVEKDAVCISSIGANTGAVFFHKGRFTPIIRLKVLIPKKDGINVRYLFHAVSIVNFAPKKSSVPNMSAKDIKMAKIRLPSLEKQEEIAYLLDKFDDLTTSIAFGLPAEIEIRKKQYEFYRDKLLSFKRKEVS